MNSCPVCPYEGLSNADMDCPACGTDLRAIRRVQELPWVLLNDGLRSARDHRYEHATRCLLAAAAFDPTRGQALLLLGKCEAQRGNIRAAVRYWKAAAGAGRHEEAEAHMERLGQLSGLAWVVLRRVTRLLRE